MYDNLKPKTLQIKEAKELIALHAKGVIRIIPQKCCVLLIKGPMDNPYIMSLARQYKDSSWVYPKQNEVTFKFLLDPKTRDLFKGVCIFTADELLKTFAGKIYTSGLILIPRREKDRMLRGLYFVRTGDINVYLESEFDDDSVKDLITNIVEHVKTGIDEGFKIWSKSVDASTRSVDGKHTYFLKEDRYIIHNNIIGTEVLDTEHLFDFLFAIYTLHE